MNETPALRTLIAARAGLTVVGDVHGDFKRMQAAVQAARDRDHALLFLGDLVNRGPASIPCAHLATALIRDGEAMVLPGNHEVRARLYAADGEMTWKDRDRTAGLIAEVEADPRARKTLDAYLDALAAMPVFARAGHWLFAHAALPPALIQREPIAFEAYERGMDADFDTTIDGARRADATARYDWLDALPAGVDLAIGHDPQPAGAPVTRTGALGARLHHLDFGCGRSNGPLITLAIPRDHHTTASLHTEGSVEAF